MMDMLYDRVNGMLASTNKPGIVDTSLDARELQLRREFFAALRRSTEPRAPTRRTHGFNGILFV